MPAPGDQYNTNEIPNPFARSVLSGYTATEIATLQARLNKQLGPEFISQRQGRGGGRVAYLEGNKAIALANEVFGFNGWSSSLGQVQVDFVDENSSGRVTLGLSIVVRITLKDGTYHEDIGYGNVENSKGKAAAFEQAKKGAATDGLKRALRTFGNVLGNCLYDKTYLNKIQSMKVAPAKFKEENLHRHSDYAPPPKKEEKEDVITLKREQQHQTPVRTNAILRTRTDNLGMSISGEFDDEFDGNLFDDVDMSESQGEEFSFDTDAAYGKSTHGTTPSRTGPQPNGGPQRPQHPQVPNNASRGTNGGSNPAPQRQPQNGNDRPPIHPSVRGPQTPAQQQGNSRVDPINARMQPPNVDIHAGPKPQTASSSNPQPPFQPARPTPPQAQPQQQHPVQKTTTPATNNPTTNPPLNHHPPIGFVTSRAAELLQHSEDTSSITQLPAFNPNAESPIPQAKRTPGLDRMASKPIKRQDVGAPEPPTPAPAGGAGSFTRPGQPQQRGNGNFINPHQDATRRIGMPGGGPQGGGGMNRGAYKPPMKRPPLQDVSNQGGGNAGSGGSGEPDPKKQRLSEGGVPAAGSGAENSVGGH